MLSARCKYKINGKVFTSKSVGTGPSSYEKRIYLAAVSQRLRNTVLNHRHEFEYTGNKNFGDRIMALLCVQCQREP